MQLLKASVPYLPAYHIYLIAKKLTIPYLGGQGMGLNKEVDLHIEMEVPEGWNGWARGCERSGVPF